MWLKGSWQGIQFTNYFLWGFLHGSSTQAEIGSPSTENPEQWTVASLNALPQWRTLDAFSNVLSTNGCQIFFLYPRTSWNIATHALTTARQWGILFLALWFRSVQHYLLQNLFSHFLCIRSVGVAVTGSSLSSQNNIGYSAHCQKQLMQVPLLGARRI